MNWFRRLLARLNPPTETAVAPNADEWQALVDSTRIDAYQQGLAQGEVRGRVLLAKEIEAEFVDTAITAADATRIRHRQIH